MANFAVDRHPQKQKIIDALLSGEPPKVIAKWCRPPIHFTTLYSFRKSVVLPALKRATQTANILNNKDLDLTPQTSLAENSSAIVATSQALETEPILRRLSAKFGRLDGAIAETLQKKDFETYAKLETTETRALELLGKATMHPGFVSSAAPSTQTVNATVIVLPQPIARAGPARDLEADEAIDITAG
jgi:hypothetical protein